MSSNNPRAKKTINETWPGVVMIIVAAAAIPIAIVSVAARGGFPWAFVLLIAIGAFAYMASRTNRRRRGHDTQDAETASEREIADLRQRVETLERIVTSKRYDLEREFEALDERRG